MSFSLDFLDEDFVLSEVTTEQKVRISSKDRSPEETFMGMRIWSNGTIFPSQALVTALSLEYTKAQVIVSEKKDKEDKPVLDQEGKPVMERRFSTEGSMACGLDIIDSQAWGDQYPQDKPRIICVGVTPKNEPKVDLFKQVGYNDDGTPINSVLDQGSDTFGKKELIPMLKEVYGIEVPEKGYVDLQIVLDKNLRKLSKTGNFYLPKKVARGERAGQADYITRTDINIYPLVPIVAEVKPETTSAATTVDSNTSVDANSLGDSAGVQA